MKIENTYGIIPIYEGENKFLILKSTKPISDSWSFPKGHVEEGEKPEETILRELKEETGISEARLLDMTPILEEIEFNRGDEKVLKINKYFIGFVKTKKVVTQKGEIDDYKWVSYEEALQIFKSPLRIKILKTAQEYLNKTQKQNV